MEISQTQTLNILDFVEKHFYEEVDIDIDGNPSKKFQCNLCDFKNSDKGGMKRHIHARHKNGGIKRSELDDTNEIPEEKKVKTDESDEFNPNLTSTQKQKLNLTVSKYSNEYLQSLLNDQYELNEELSGIEAPTLEETLMDDDEKEDMKANVDDAVRTADVALLNIKIKKIEESYRLKELECAEKDATIESLENEQFVSKEEVVKLRDEMKTKDALNESNLGRINSLEERINSLEEIAKERSDRVDILEPLTNKLMHENKVLKGNQNAKATKEDKKDDEETKKIRKELKTKTQMIKTLNEHKSQLANELKELQEKAHGDQNKDVVEKCIKLTNEIASKKTENKTFEKENKKLVETLASLQTAMNETNNKLAEAQVSNIRIKEFNTQMFELVKGSKLVEELEKDHKKDIEEQNVVFNANKTKESKPKSKSEPKKQSPLNNSRSKKVEKKCWYFENGFCRKGSACNFLHPTEICKYFSKYGQCPQGLVCPLRHPLTICMSYMEGGCNMGDMCVLQHPINTSPSRVSQPTPPTPAPAPSYPPPPYPVPAAQYRAPFVQNNPNFSTPQTNQRQPMQQMPWMAFGHPGTFPSGQQTPPHAPHNVSAQSYPAHGSPSTPAGPSNGQQQQGFW